MSPLTPVGSRKLLLTGSAGSKTVWSARFYKGFIQSNKVEHSYYSRILNYSYSGRLANTAQLGSTIDWDESERRRHISTSDSGGVFLLQHMSDVTTKASLWIEWFNQRLLTRSAGILELKDEKRIFFLSWRSTAPAVDGSDSAGVPRDKFTGRVTTSPGDSPRLHNQRRAPLMTDSHSLCALDSVSHVSCPKSHFQAGFYPSKRCQAVNCGSFLFPLFIFNSSAPLWKTRSLLQTEMINFKTFGCFSLWNQGAGPSPSEH